jgi:hypothetical protein
MLSIKDYEDGKMFCSSYCNVTVMGMSVASFKYEGVAGALWVIFTLHIGRSFKRTVRFSPIQNY